MSDTAPMTGALAEPGPLERSVALVLRIGVVLSTATIATGTVLTLASSGTRRAAAAALPALRRGAIRPSGDVAYRSLASLFHGLGPRPGPSLVMIGVVLLVATPVLRVAVSVVSFARAGERRYVVITTLVLAVLISSFALG